MINEFKYYKEKDFMDLILYIIVISINVYNFKIFIIFIITFFYIAKNIKRLNKKW